MIAGVGDYGNKIGVPTIAGAIVHDPSYTTTPLVFAGCLGVLPTGSHPTEPQPGDSIVVLGGAVGRDGVGGATFSSQTMGVETADIAGSSVQIGDPIVEKGLIDVVVEARDRGLYNAITDCGAGGLSSAVGEMAEKLGAEVDLDRSLGSTPACAVGDLAFRGPGTDGARGPRPGAGARARPTMAGGGRRHRHVHRRRSVAGRRGWRVRRRSRHHLPPRRPTQAAPHRGGDRRRQANPTTSAGRCRTG